MANPKDVCGYEGLYQIDEVGNLFSYPNSRNKTYRQMVPNLHRDGYRKVCLYKDGVVKTHMVHRLVAQTFIPNEAGLKQVNHKDGNKLNNSVDNLEWVTPKQNAKHAVANNLGGMKDRLDKGLNLTHRYKEVIMVKDGNLYRFDSVEQAARELDLNMDRITECIRKEQKVAGYIVIGIK